MSRKAFLRAATAAMMSAAAAAAFVVDASPAAYAQATRTFVSGHGMDTGTCSVTSPCRSFAYAVTQTANAGEIVVLDSAGYGPVTITRSLTITNPGGVEAGVTATEGNAVTIAAGAPSNVTLRGLTLEGGGVAASGIAVTSALAGNSAFSTLNILGCVIKDFVGSGVAVQPTLASGGVPDMTVTIADSFIQNNAANGLLFQPGDVVVLPSMYRLIVSGNGDGINITTSSNIVSAILSDSHVDNNNTVGIIMNAGSLAPTMTMRNTTVEQTSGLSITGDVVVNGLSSLNLYGGNTIRILGNSGITTSDGTNNIGSVLGSSLQRTALQ